MWYAFRLTDGFRMRTERRDSGLTLKWQSSCKRQWASYLLISKTPTPSMRTNLISSCWRYQQSIILLWGILTALQVRHGDKVTNKEILKFSKLFEDEVTLEKVSREVWERISFQPTLTIPQQLVAMHNYLYGNSSQAIKWFSTDYLRTRISNKIEKIKQDDMVRFRSLLFIFTNAVYIADPQGGLSSNDHGRIGGCKCSERNASRGLEPTYDRATVEVMVGFIPQWKGASCIVDSLACLHDEPNGNIDFIAIYGSWFSL